MSVFDEAELRSLKEELRTARPVPVVDGRTLPSVGFRLEPAYFEKLKSRGAVEGFSPGEYARHLVVQSLETDAAALLKGFTDLRQGLGEMLFVLLISRLDMTEAEARDLLKKTALRTGERS